MAKKINQATTPESGEAKMLQTKSVLEKKFDELTHDKKRSYLHTIFWTVRGCTWFFDTRFTAGMSDYKTFDIGDENMADVIIKNSGTYSDAWWWSESDNSIGIIFQWNIYRWWWVRYFETKRIDRKDLQYQEITDCIFDQSKNEFTVSVKCADDSQKKIVLKEWSKHTFEEDLIAKLRVPKELLQNKEEIKKVLQAEISQEEKELATQNMYQKALDIFILKDNWAEAEKYIDRPWIRLSEDQKKQYGEYLLNGRKQWYGREMTKDSMEKLLLLLQTSSDQSYRKEMCEKALEKSLWWYDQKTEWLFQEAIQLWLQDQEVWETKKIEKLMESVFSWGDRFDILDTMIQQYKQDPKIWYQKILEKAYEDKIMMRYNLDYVDQIVVRLSQNLSRSEEDIYQDIFVKNIDKKEEIWYYELKSIVAIMESKWYDKELYNQIFDKVANNKTIRKDRYYSDTIAIIEMMTKIKSQIQTKFPQDFFIDILQIYANREKKLPYHNMRDKYSGDYSPLEKDQILEKLSQKYITRHTNITTDDLANRWLKDQKTILWLIEYMFGEAQDFKEGESFIKILKEKNLVDSDLEEKINEIYVRIASEYLQWKKANTQRRCAEYTKYAPKDLVEEYVNNKLKEYSSHPDNKDSSFYFSHMAICLLNAGYDQQYLQNKIMAHISSDQYDLAAKWIKWLGLDIDKVRVNTLIEQLFQEWKVQEAEKLSQAWWLYDIRKDKIVSRKLENKKLDYRDAKRSIEELKLDKSYYKYVVDILMTKWDLKEALELAQKNNLLISQEQFDWYLSRDERLRKADEERKLREKKERESQATEMMKDVLASKISCDINYTQDQKYVLIRDKQDWLKLASKNLEWHRDIVSDIHANKKDVVWGGRLLIDDQQKTVKIYGRSGDFGKVESEYNEVLKTIIKIQYTDYEITIE